MYFGHKLVNYGNIYKCSSLNMHSNNTCMYKFRHIFITSVYTVAFFFILLVEFNTTKCGLCSSVKASGLAQCFTDLSRQKCLKTSKKLPVTFVVYRQEVHQEHVVCHGIHPKYFHLESWKHSPGKEKKKHWATVKSWL